MYTHPYSNLKAELEATKQELLESLIKHQQNLEADSKAKTKKIVQYIKEDLDDVERALLKFQVGMFGIDEMTGQLIPMEKLKILPTARTTEDIYLFH